MNTTENRPIKFRAWDKVSSKMIVTDFHITCFGIVWNAHNPHDEVNYELMQFTGLKDKNGKEIYEGDVLRIGTSPNAYPIYYDGEKAWFTTCKKDNSYLDVGNWSHAKIIGNIYENPELLNQPETK